MFAQDARHPTLQPPPPPAAAALAASPQWRGGPELHDELAAARNDLARLQRLLDDASRALLGHFVCGRDPLDRGAPDGARQTFGSAITALQFHDLASQLIAHTSLRLRHCAGRIGGASGGTADADFAARDDAPLAPGPVSQDEIGAGSVELF